MLLTRVPVGAAPLTTADRARAAAWFPVVGLGLGAVGALALHLAGGGLLGAGLALAVVVLLTGGLHEDGLADTADALGGARDRERLFAILKDSRIGTFGALAIGFSLLLRAAALARLGGLAPAAFVLAQVAARAAPVWLMAALPYVTPASVARTGDVARARVGHVVAATGFALAVAGVIVGMDELGAGAVMAAVVAAAAITAVAGLRFRARAGGVTGDFLGASQQLAEIALLTALAVGIPG